MNFLQYEGKCVISKGEVNTNRSRNSNYYSSFFSLKLVCTTAPTASLVEPLISNRGMNTTTKTTNQEFSPLKSVLYSVITLKIVNNATLSIWILIATDNIMTLGEIAILNDLFMIKCFGSS